MTTLWTTIVAIAVANAAIKAAGPLLVGEDLPARAGAVIELLAPALLTALVVTETFGEDGRLALDASGAGLVAAAAALAVRAPMLAAISAAALVTALVRALG